MFGGVEPALCRLKKPEKRDVPQFRATDWRFMALTLAWCVQAG